MNLTHEGVLDPNEPDFRDEKREAEEARRECETVAGIVADIRGRADCAEQHGDRETHNDGVAMFLRSIADRIEAAWKREREAVEADALAVGGIVEAARHTPGNAAAMREALVKLVEIIDKYDGGSPLWWHSGAKGVIPIKNAKAALSTPPRNCDLPLVVDGPADNNADKAWLVFKRHNPDAYFDVSGLLRCIDWLLAPAAERKGEGDDD